MSEPLYNNSVKPEHEPRTYFAFVECVEVIDSDFFRAKKVFVRFDCLMISEARKCTKGKKITNAFLSELPVIQIECIELQEIIKESIGQDVLEVEV